MIRAIYGFIALSLFSLTACQPPAQEESMMSESEMSEMAMPAGLSQDDVDAIQAATQAWADGAKANDWAAVAELYAEDGTLMPPNHDAVKGRAAIQEFLATFPPVSDMQLENVEVEGAGDMAFTRGRYTLTLTPEGAEPITDSGKYITVHRKQADGSWPLYLDQYNSDLPLPQ